VELLDVQRNWNSFGESDPLWAVLSHTDKRDNSWELDDFFETGRASVAEALARAAAYGFPKQRKLALDFGCGVGRLTQALGELFERVVGVDIAPSMVRRARDLNRLGPRCEYVVNGAPDLHLLDGREFDFVFSSIVLQHVHPRYSLAYIREFVRLLAPGGLALFDLTAEQGNVSPLPPQAFSARIAPTAPALRLPAGEQSPVSARITNTSLVDWSTPVNLGNHWLTADGAMLAYDDARGAVPVPLRVGESTEASVSVTAPNVPGQYLLELDLVQEGVAWFGVHGSPTARIPVVVEPAVEHHALGSAESGVPLVPMMEMYGVPLPVVAAAAVDAGGRVVAIDPSNAGGPGWFGYRYAVTRS
jgi:hypothetical protein